MRYVRLFPIALLALLLLFLGDNASADGPFTPTYSFTLDEVAPDNPDILPADDECPVGAACKSLWWAEVPDGQPAFEVSGILPYSILGLADDAFVPDGAIVGKVVGVTRFGPIGACPTEPIIPYEGYWLDATTDASTTTGSASDLCSFSNWPSQLNGVRDDFLAANPDAVLNRRWVACSPVMTTNVLFFAHPDGSVSYTVVADDPTIPRGGVNCGPHVVKSVALGLSADNPDTPADEGGIPLHTCTAAGTQTFRVFLDRTDTPPGDPVVLDDIGTCSPNTPAGSGVSVPLNGGTTALAGIDVTFSEVTSGGTTTVVTTQEGPSPPVGFSVAGLGGVPLYFDISTTATFTGDVEVCARYDDAGLTTEQEAALQLLRYNGVDWVNRTSSIDADNNIICGTAPSFSVWAVMAPSAVGGVVELAAERDVVSYQPASSGPLPIGASVALGVLVLGAGGLYVVKMQRG